MKKFYQGHPALSAGYYVRVAIAALIMLSSSFLQGAHAQGLVFKNSVLESGVAGQDNAMYRFANVTANVDALVKINGRSSELVQLVAIDLTNTGFDKSFQPQVTFNNNTTPSGTNDWWMEFGITFVQHNTSTPVNVVSFDVTTLDLDGNNDKINEWVNVYGLESYSFEANTLLQYANVWELVSGISTLTGKHFAGPITNFTGIDTSATVVMCTSQFSNSNAMRVRTGGHSTGQSGAADRMYSFWFRSFDYQAPVEIRLPVSLQSFTVQLENKQPVLNWVASAEKNLSHYVVQRSSSGTDFSDAALLFTQENLNSNVAYRYTDKAAGHAGILYYRLKMVDMDGKYEYSATRLLRLDETNGQVQLQTYPNPAHNELRVTIPSAWQQQRVQYELYNANGQKVRQLARSIATQTEVMDLSGIPEGIYILKVISGGAQATQRFVKTK